VRNYIATGRSRRGHDVEGHDVGALDMRRTATVSTDPEGGRRVSNYPPGPPRPPGQGPYGPPVGGPQGWNPPDQAPRRSVKPAVLIGIVLIVVAVGVGVALAMSGDGDGNNNSAEDAVRRYLDTFRRGDCEEMAAMAASATFEITPRDEWMSGCQQVVETFRIDQMQVDDVELTSEEGDNATVSMTMALGGRTDRVDVDVVRENGTWKVIDEGWGAYGQ